MDVSNNFICIVKAIEVCNRFAHVNSYNLIYKDSNSQTGIVSNDSSYHTDNLLTVRDIWHKMVKVDYSEAKFQHLCYLPNLYECC